MTATPNPNHNISATFRFYADLNDFLPYKHRQQSFAHSFAESSSVKDTVESLGIPHTEIDLLLVNGDPVDFDHPLQDGDRVSIYPRFAALDIRDVSQVLAEPPAPRFVLDVHLGKLADYLRLLGFDALFPENYDDANLARISEEENRIMLSRDRGLLKRGRVAHGYHPRSTNPREQLIEVLRRYDLAGEVRPFTRCLRCNGVLEDVAKADIIEKIAPRTQQFYDEFRQCTACGQVYWRGTHYIELLAFMEEALAGVNQG